MQRDFSPKRNWKVPEGGSGAREVEEGDDRVLNLGIEQPQLNEVELLLLQFASVLRQGSFRDVVFFSFNFNFDVTATNTTLSDINQCVKVTRMCKKCVRENPTNKVIFSCRPKFLFLKTLNITYYLLRKINLHMIKQ